MRGVGNLHAQQVKPLLPGISFRTFADFIHGTVRHIAGVDYDFGRRHLSLSFIVYRLSNQSTGISTLMSSVPKTLTWQARRALEPTPTRASSFSFSSRVVLVTPLRPSTTKTWQEPHLALPSHLCVKSGSA